MIIHPNDMRVPWMYGCMTILGMNILCYLHQYYCLCFTWFNLVWIDPTIFWYFPCSLLLLGNRNIDSCEKFLVHREGTHYGGPWYSISVYYESQ